MTHPNGPRCSGVGSAGRWSSKCGIVPVGHPPLNPKMGRSKQPSAQSSMNPKPGDRQDEARLQKERGGVRSSAHSVFWGPK